MAGGAESAEKAWQWALPMSSVPLYVQQEEQHDKAHNDQAYCVKHAYNEIYLGTLSNKKNDIIWEFFPNVGPPSLLGTPYHNGPFGAKNGRTWQACRCPKAV